MPKDAVFTLKLELDLRDAFMAEAEAADRPASQVVRELMREFVHRRQEERSYKEFLIATVEASLASYEKHGGVPHEEVEAEFRARREAARAAMR